MTIFGALWYPSVPLATGLRMTVVKGRWRTWEHVGCMCEWEDTRMEVGTFGDTEIRSTIVKARYCLGAANEPNAARFRTKGRVQGSFFATLYPHLASAAFATGM